MVLKKTVGLLPNQTWQPGMPELELERLQQLHFTELELERLQQLHFTELELERLQQLATCGPQVSELAQFAQFTLCTQCQLH